MYDRNGLELTPIQNSLNAYKFTAVNVKSRSYSAYAQATRSKGIYSMVTIAKYSDPRDAAFVGQQFAKMYNEQQVFEMVVDDVFKQVAYEFIETLDIPQWQYPAEGLDWDDIVGFDKTTANRIQNGREALVEALKHAGKKAPAINIAKQLIERVEQLFEQGYSYRQAAKLVVEDV